MRQLAITVDLDGIVADLHAAWLDDINRRAGLQLTKPDIHTYQMEQVVPPGVDVYAFLNTPGAYERLPALDGALEHLEQLHADGHHVLVATMPVPRVESTTEKLRWLQVKMPWLNRKRIYIGGEKDRIISDVFIDDDPSNLRAFRQRQPQAYLATIAWPYNEGLDTEGTVNLRAQDCCHTDAAWKTMYQGITMFANQDTPAASAQ